MGGVLFFVFFTMSILIGDYARAMPLADGPPIPICMQPVLARSPLSAVTHRRIACAGEMMGLTLPNTPKDGWFSQPMASGCRKTRTARL